VTFSYRILTSRERFEHRGEVTIGRRFSSPDAKYEVTANSYVDLGRFFPDGAPVFDIEGGALAENGLVLIRKGFRWDGPSGPALDTADFMRGSCVHDLGYQAMRLRVISTVWRDEFDEAMRAVASNDGMPRWYGWLAFTAVRLFAARAAKGKR
jgi:hypothetical protein